MSYSLQNIFHKFTNPWAGDNSIYPQLEDFAKSLGWYPSDIIEEKKNNSLATGHLFVEHGLDNSAVITFLNKRNQFSTLNYREQNSLLKVSYNNLVDLHISVDDMYVNGLHNRIENNNLLYSGYINENFENLTSDFYSKILSERKIRANLLSIEDSIIDTISYWKRYLSSELNNNISNESLSNLFNAIIFCRAIEDHFNNNNKNFYSSSEDKLLISLLIKDPSDNLINVIDKLLNKYNISSWPNDVIDKLLLNDFNCLNNNTLYRLINDFYLNKHTPYEYDFSIISKHALSRIYERYVSILKVEENIQSTLFAPIPVEVSNKSSGSYYTPQFIARFFSRYIEQQIPDFKSKELKVIEPSIGSGIFLRTFLEMKCGASENNDLNSIKRNFENVLGVDINPTACHAAKLSLSLLHLVTANELPSKSLNIKSSDALEYFKGNRLNDSIDIVISNPPFVSYNALSEEVRTKVKHFLDDSYFGRSDLYLSFIKIALNTLVEGGLGLFVLPNTFLVSESAKLIRKSLAENTVIKCIVDLSDIQVFDTTGIYPILLIFQKNSESSVNQDISYTTIAKIQDKVGKALTDVLSKASIEDPSYSIYTVPNRFFKSDSWYLLPPTIYNLKTKLSTYKKLIDYTEIRTGFSSGASEIFLIEKKLIPKGEEGVYIPFLSDREMAPYNTPTNVDKYFFYPFEGSTRLSEQILSEKFPKTFNYLVKNKLALEKRNEVVQKRILWWEPNRPRKPDFMLIPKILTPHLVFTPKFSLDIAGKFAVTRTPFIVLNDDITDQDLLYYFVAVLNSSVCFWYLLNHAPKYQHGYAMLEKKYLSDLPIPDPEGPDRIKIMQIIKLVKERISINSGEGIQLENKIDSLITDLYNLTTEERDFLNL